MKCPTCGCTTHSPALTWPARCSRCKKIKYPHKVEKPDSMWVCTLCSMESPRATASQRAWAGRKARRGVQADARAAS